MQKYHEILFLSLSVAYGYGFLMVFIVCLASLAGLAIIPVIHLKSPVGRQIYEYSYAFMVALAASALICDALLHLVPQVSIALTDVYYSVINYYVITHIHVQVFNLHQHGGVEEEGSDHSP